MPRRTEPKRVSAALAERTGFDRFVYIGKKIDLWRIRIIFNSFQLFRDRRRLTALILTKTIMSGVELLLDYQGLYFLTNLPPQVLMMYSYSLSSLLTKMKT